MRRFNKQPKKRIFPPHCPHCFHPIAEAGCQTHCEVDQRHNAPGCPWIQCVICSSTLDALGNHRCSNRTVQCRELPPELLGC